MVTTRHPEDLAEGYLLCRACDQVRPRQSFYRNRTIDRGYTYTCIRCTRRRCPVRRTVSEWRAAGII